MVVAACALLSGHRQTCGGGTVGLPWTRSRSSCGRPGCCPPRRLSSCTSRRTGARSQSRSAFAGNDGDFEREVDCLTTRARSRRASHILHLPIGLAARWHARQIACPLDDMGARACRRCYTCLALLLHCRPALDIDNGLSHEAGHSHSQGHGHSHRCALSRCAGDAAHPCFRTLRCESRRCRDICSGALHFSQRTASESTFRLL